MSSDVRVGVGEVITALAASPWLAIAAAMAAFLLLIAGLQLYARTASPPPETTRKLLHVGSGLITLAFPFIFREAWPVVLLAVASALIVGAARFVPAVRARIGSVAHRVERATFGELYFPLAVAWLFWLTCGEYPLLFVIPVLMLTLADAAAAIVGARYGLTPYVGASKSLEGSAAFAVVAFLCVQVPLLAWSDVGRIESSLIAATIALLVMLLEAIAARGLDNVVIPLAAYVLLRSSLALDTEALLSVFLVAVVVVLRGGEAMAELRLRLRGHSTLSVPELSSSSALGRGAVIATGSH